MYGPNSFDYKFIYNVAMTYQPPYFRAQHGIAGHILGGWTISPIFTALSGAPIGVSYSEGSCTACMPAFGEVTPSSGVTTSAENAVGAAAYTGGSSAIYNVSGSNGTGTTNSTGDQHVQ